ncbi:Protein HIM-4 a, partial [Aphelenchoides avenae]
MLESRRVVEVQINETRTIACPEDERASSVTWTRNGATVSPSSSLQISGSGRKMHIMRAQTHDSGRYACIAENEAGEAEATFDVTVLVPPTIQGPTFRTTEAVANRSVEIQCHISGIP